ncbi:unnamed protein product, partial [marine sediment metagenome]
NLLYTFSKADRSKDFISLVSYHKDSSKPVYNFLLAPPHQFQVQLNIQIIIEFFDIDTSGALNIKDLTKIINDANIIVIFKNYVDAGVNPFPPNDIVTKTRVDAATKVKT